MTDAHAILIVDDDPFIRDVLQRQLESEGYRIVCAPDGDVALLELQRQQFSALITDVQMPRLNGHELLRCLARIAPDVQVIVITVIQNVHLAVELMKQGACDLIFKPFEPCRISVAVLKAIERRRLILENRAYRDQLESEKQLLQERCAETEHKFQQLYLQATRSLAFSLEAKDPYTENHSRRVGAIAAHIGRKLDLDAAYVEELETAGHLHDIGKIGVRESVLHKPGPLTCAEYEHIQQHPSISARILSPLQHLGHICLFVKHHHERCDGRGYPDGLEDRAIPFGARIVATADAADAIISTRPYRKGSSVESACDEIRRNAGSQFDPEVVHAFLRLMDNGVLATIYGQNAAEASNS